MSRAAAENSYAGGRERWHHAGVSDVLDELDWRGLIGQSTGLGEPRKALGRGPVTFGGATGPTGDPGGKSASER